ncbi:DUF294 nucleotidyltransferase-like domain-containing protein [Fictibacillus sp. NRS-1165]|uniref:DUF294 nucleotidyltransferase-like domain-containing protein n=1 Tax=Fictibacillus sp. NRS-1165 TaxID=3144463 RepID=UPI003D2050A1
MQYPFDEPNVQTSKKEPDLQERLAKAGSLEELREIHMRIIPMIQGLSASGHSIEYRYNMLNNMHDVLTRRAVSLAYDAAKKTFGEPPGGKLCFFSMGSSARHEQTVWTDQDNGLIYQTVRSDEVEYRAFAEEFSRTAVQYLAEVGYPLCQGNVMASNCRWRHHEEDWREQLLFYLNNGSEENLKYMMIMLDTKQVYGVPALLFRLRKWFVHELHQRPMILKKMRELVTSHEIPMNMFGMIFTERWGKYSGRFDLKQGVFAPYINSIKILSVLYGNEAQSTRERILELNEKGFITATETEQYMAVYDFLLELRLKHSIGLAETDDRLDYHLRLSEMEPKNVQELKRIMKQIKAIQKQTKKRGPSFEQSTGI